MRIPRWNEPTSTSSTPTPPAAPPRTLREGPANALDVFRQDAGLSHLELWWRYFELGGMSTSFQLEACLHGVLQTTAHDHDLIAQALNERFAEQGGDHLVPYCSEP